MTGINLYSRFILFAGNMDIGHFQFCRRGQLLFRHGGKNLFNFVQIPFPVKHPCKFKAGFGQVGFLIQKFFVLQHRCFVALCVAQQPGQFKAFMRKVQRLPPNS